jgi:hypothetical protein
LFDIGTTTEVALKDFDLHGNLIEMLHHFPSEQWFDHASGAVVLGISAKPTTAIHFCGLVQKHASS